MYNSFTQNYCYQNEISYINITDITRLGLENPELVSVDNLHPSGPQTILFEDENKVKIQTFDKYKDADIFQIITSEITYKDGKIVTQKTVSKELDYDPSEGQDWNWEDYE